LYSKNAVSPLALNHVRCHTAPAAFLQVSIDIAFPTSKQFEKRQF